MGEMGHHCQVIPASILVPMQCCLDLGHCLQRIYSIMIYYKGMHKDSSYDQSKDIGIHRSGYDLIIIGKSIRLDENLVSLILLTFTREKIILKVPER